MFLNDRDKVSVRGRSLTKMNLDGDFNGEKSYVGIDSLVEEHIYAEPEVYDGITYISAFIRVKDDFRLEEFEAKGVQIHCVFSCGILTAIIHIDSIESVACLESVKRINVAQLMRPTTDASRLLTKTNEVLTNSINGTTMNLPKIYDGSGVIIGIIDNGIDFQHIAFKDQNGNSRIKRAYIWNGKTKYLQTYTNINNLTTDNEKEDHGTHTSSIAGGSSVIINGNDVIVTEDHVNATYGGIAPNSELCLAGIYNLNSTRCIDAMTYICAYADSVGKPLVLSMSLETPLYPHDGTGEIEDITAELFGDNKPNRICLFASGNAAGRAGSSIGGYHVAGYASSSAPIGSVLRFKEKTQVGGYCYKNVLVQACSRSAVGGSLACNIFVLDSNSGEVKECIPVISRGDEMQSIKGLDKFFLGTLYAYFDYYDCPKSQMFLYTQNGFEARGNYILAVQFYPTNGNCMIDMWAGESGGYFTNLPSTNGIIWRAGNDDSSISGHAVDPNAISVGAYVSKKDVKDYKGVFYPNSDNYVVGDILYMSGYQKAGCGPTGERLPWITAPGSTVVSAVNSYHKIGGYIDDKKVRINTNTKYPYGCMSGTSMATPVAAGIVALWLQAAIETNQSLTTSDVKNIMKTTAISDSYTNGVNASHFGNGKIDALGGLKYILRSSNVYFADKYVLKLQMDSQEYLNIKILEGRANRLAECDRMQVLINKVDANSGGVCYQNTFNSCEARILLNPYFYPNGIYAITILLFDDTSDSPTIVTTKYYKNGC